MRANDAVDKAQCKYNIIITNKLQDVSASFQAIFSWFLQ